MPGALVRRRLLGIAAAIVFADAAIGAEYRDTAGAFTLSYDEAIWTVTSGPASEDFSIACKSGGCEGVTAGCSGSRLWVPLASIGRLTREFDAKETERAILDSLAKEKAEREQGKAVRADNVPPQVVKPYTLNHTSGG
jgi:hypothetical protein